MKLPSEYDDDFLEYETGFGASYPDGTPIRSRVYSLVFPPPGFFPFYGIGNGDYHGFYWPIGREDGPPIIAFSSHDVWSLIPENSDIESLYRCQLATSNGDTDILHRYRDLAEIAIGKPTSEHNIRGLKHDDFNGLLLLDPKSPFYLCAAADVHVGNNEIEAAEQRYRQSLDELPEYVAAHFGLAYVLRRQRRGEEATVYLRQSLLGPLALYGGSFWANTSLPGSFRNDWHRKALMWLQSSKTVHESIADDPFIRSIDKLTFQSGLAVNPDLDVLRAIIDEYVAKGRYADAARTWQLIGDRACLETCTFRERYNLNPTTYGKRLAELLELAGNVFRTELIKNMLTKIEKPEGQYL
jgi:hypothetical protein